MLNVIKYICIESFCNVTNYNEFQRLILMESLLEPLQRHNKYRFNQEILLDCKLIIHDRESS